MGSEVIKSRTQRENQNLVLSLFRSESFFFPFQERKTNVATAVAFAAGEGILSHVLGILVAPGPLPPPVDRSVPTPDIEGRTKNKNNRSNLLHLFASKPAPLQYLPRLPP
jgi:hypothetical protein